MFKYDCIIIFAFKCSPFYYAYFQTKSDPNGCVQIFYKTHFMDWVNSHNSKSATTSAEPQKWAIKAENGNSSTVCTSVACYVQT